MTLHSVDGGDLSSGSNIAGFIISTGLWHARYSGLEFANEHRRALDMAAQYTPRKRYQSHAARDAYLAVAPAIILPPPVLNHHWLNPERAETLSPQRLANITKNLLEYQETHGIEVAWSARAMTVNNTAAITSGGLHVTRELAAYQAEILLNRVCNHILFSGSKKASSLPCVRQSPWQITVKSCLVLFCLLLLSYYLALGHQRDSKLFASRLQGLIVVFAVTSYCWLADRTLVFEKGNKLVDVRLFCFCTAALLAASLTRLRSIPCNADHTLPFPKAQDMRRPSKTTFLPREITEEWKGWMQIVILLYHYFGMSKVLPVYQGVRVLVASYLFMTGYGHAAYFLKTKDFSLRRIVKVVIRLNLLTCLLSGIMENNHEFYYFPSLATIWFFVTYAVFWRPVGRQTSAKELVARMVAMLSFSYIVVGNERLLDLFFDFLRQVSGPEISTKDFIFRFRLDLLAPFAGICTAIFEGKIPSRERLGICDQSRAKVDGWLVNLIQLAMSLLTFVSYTYIAGTFGDKPSYNAWHTVLSLIPIAAYVNMRKVLWNIGNYFAPTLAWVGSISLELFVLQYHIWLAADTKGLLRLGLFDGPHTMPMATLKGSWTYWLETTVVTIFFVWMSHCCSRATNVLVEWFVHVDVSVPGGKRILLIRLVATSSFLWGLKIASAAESRW